MLKLLLNRPEAETDASLRHVCEAYGARVFPKVRVADVLPIEQSGISADLYRYALQSHFDFVAAESSHRPLFAVEFDGPAHSKPPSAERDRKKAALCERFQCPLLRITSRYLSPVYRGMNLLSWCIEAWFVQRAFETEQAAGHIPFDEPFDALAICRMSGNPNRFPLWLSCDIYQEFRAWAAQGVTLDPAPSCVLGRDGSGNIRALSFTRISPSSGVFARSAMRSQMFPIDLPDLLNEVAAFELHEAVQQVHSGGRRPLPIASVKAQIDEFMRTHTFLGGHYASQGRSPLVPTFPTA